MNTFSIAILGQVTFTGFDGPETINGIVLRGEAPAIRECGKHLMEPIVVVPAEAYSELVAALKWFIDDIDGSHTSMVDFDANVERARAAIVKVTGGQS